MVQLQRIAIIPTTLTRYVWLNARFAAGTGVKGLGELAMCPPGLHFHNATEPPSHDLCSFFEDCFAMD